ncbi:PucR C-terminal helix-turn-helix domain-containing protein [Parafrankia irregularis]|uniref:PucR C-terminal helix-turn-helix domain-containing protein n=1 Tax=Parafrankia irregularis TaxID=795642 RepID=A0A0S4QMX0_9ACTN|nr:helix-turn-helix domain-containing protein [Parafrankia irregularis]CUU55862.1 PucR C-terminal helix-turn-helix domain-containing protein [Parafrankia irregularis]
MQVTGLPGTSLTRLPRAAVLAAADARLHAGLLGNYLDVLASTADSGRRLTRAELDTFRALGQAAAESGASLPALVDLYLSATWRVWPSLPTVRQADRLARFSAHGPQPRDAAGRPAEATGGSDEATGKPTGTGPAVGAVSRTRAAASAVLRASDDVVAAVCDGYERARTARARSEEALRRELVDDLLTGTSEVGLLLERAAAFGFRLEAPHVLLVSAGSRRFLDGRAVVREIEETLRRQCPTEPLVATKDGLLVCVVPQESELTLPVALSSAGLHADAAGTGTGIDADDGSGTATRAEAGSDSADQGDAHRQEHGHEHGGIHGDGRSVGPGGAGPGGAGSEGGVVRSGQVVAAPPPGRGPAVHTRADGGSGHPRIDRPTAADRTSPRTTAPRGRRRLDPPAAGDVGFVPMPGVAPAEAAPAAAIRAITRRLAVEPELVWRLGVSRARSGVAGVRISFEEARNAVELAGRMRLDGQVVHTDDLLIYKVLLRDREPLEELVDTVLSPLRSARGGAAPLIETLDAYFATGGVALAAARRLHLSVRALTYRLDRIHALTKHDPTSPTDRYVLQTAVIGARLIDWEGAFRRQSGDPGS